LMENSKQIQQLKNEVTAANMGRQVLSNKAYQDALTIRKAQIFEVFCNTTKDQADVREESWRTMKNMTALENYFNQLLATGKMASQTLSQYSEKED